MHIQSDGTDRRCWWVNLMFSTSTHLLMFNLRPLTCIYMSHVSNCTFNLHPKGHKLLKKTKLLQLYRSHWINFAPSIKSLVEISQQNSFCFLVFFKRKTLTYVTNLSHIVVPGLGIVDPVRSRSGSSMLSFSWLFLDSPQERFLFDSVFYT